MGKVIKLQSRKPIPPKSISDIHAGQRYTVTFDPNAAPGEQWVWIVDFTRTYRFIGACPSIEHATRDARKRIHRLVIRQQKEEESE